MIIRRYLIREIGKKLVAILAILIALFASFSAADILADAVNGLLPTGMIATLIGLKVLISLEVLIPISLYLAVVLSFGRLHGDSEFPAMFALGITPARVMGAVLGLSCCLAGLVGGLSLIVRPWAYHTMHDISRRAETALDVSAMQAGTFYIARHGDRVIFLAHRAGPQAPARQVFVLNRHRDRLTIMSAEGASPPSPDSGRKVYLKDARIYEIGRAKGKTDQILSAQGALVNPDSASPGQTADGAAATGTLRLAGSHRPEDVAEFQWRLSTSVSTLLLGMLGVPLSGAAPGGAPLRGFRLRQGYGRHAKLGIAILVYTTYYLLCLSARTLVEHRTIPRLPGLWWAPGLLALLLLVLLAAPRATLNLDFARRHRAKPVVAPGNTPQHDAA